MHALYMNIAIVYVYLNYVFVAIKNGQSRETGNIGYKRHRTKTNNTNNITQKNKNELHQKPG
jgi:hypothetical protein